MKKINIPIIAALAMFGIAGVANAAPFAVSAPSQTQANYYPNETERVVFQFDVTVPASDVVTDIAIKNNSLAPTGYILRYELWQDNGNNTFYGSFEETLVGEGVRDINGGRVYWSDIDREISGTSRFYVTIDTAGKNTITTQKTLEYQLFLEDLNGNGSFDFQNDFGVFLASGNAGPAEGQVFVNDKLNIYTSSIDQSLPVGYIETPQNQATLFGDSFTITGGAFDQGGGSILGVDVIINGQAFEAETANGFSEWFYDWSNVAEGNYDIEIRVRDTNNNTNPSAYSLSVSVETADVSPAQSTVSKSAETALADNSDSIAIFVTLRDSQGNAVDGKSVDLVWKDDVPTTVNKDQLSDHAGLITINVKSLQEMITTLEVYYQGNLIGAETIAFSNDQDSLPPVLGVDAQSGDRIKASGAAIYYLGADGKRYVFPDEKTYLSWYNDFSGVVTITDAELAMIPIGGNVTYRPGVYLIKITTDPKVYAVASDGTLRWITTAEIAASLYGNDWAALVRDVPDPFFVNYAIGEQIDQASDFDPAQEISTASSINVDKGL